MVYAILQLMNRLIKYIIPVFVTLFCLGHEANGQVAVPENWDQDIYALRHAAVTYGKGAKHCWVRHQKTGTQSKYRVPVMLNETAAIQIYRCCTSDDGLFCRHPQESMIRMTSGPLQQQ